ncbi:MAG: hypothetical protein U5K56_17835 [Halioglobus sp.]|nr:hypothetical protein [Halioglobus sp.]
MWYRSLHVVMAATLALVLSVSYQVNAQENGEAGNGPESASEQQPLDELVGEKKKCVSLARIDRTRVVDDRSILFYMRGGDIYMNRLPHRCIGLRRGETFMYKTSLNQLCNVDIITVLDDIGFGFSRGASCGLGSFQLIGEEAAKMLLSRERE